MSDLPSVHLAAAVRLLRAAGHKNAGDFGAEAERLLLAERVMPLVSEAERLERTRNAGKEGE